MAFPKVLTLEKHITNDEARGDMCNYIENQVEYLMGKTKNLREELLPKWVKTYKGTPEIEHKSFPWPEASNLVIQLCATHADELLSRIMSIYQSEQLFVASILGDFKKGIGDDQREMIEKFMSDAALDPMELDLYRVEEVVFASAGRYGTGIAKFPWNFEQEQVYTGKEGADPFDLKTIHDGPRPENVPLNRFIIDPATTVLRNASFMAHIVAYKKPQLRELIEKSKADLNIFNTTVLEDILAAGPDRSGPDYMQAMQEESKGMNNNWGNVGGEWDFHECWFSWWHGGKKYRIIAHWHHKTKKLVGGIFNPYPMNEVPFEDAKLAYDDDQYYGYGFMEMLEMYQREVSRNHNQRVDNRDLANTGVVRVNVGSSLASVIQIYPGAIIPAPKDELELLQLGSAIGATTEDEMLTLSLAKDRSGVDPAVGGSGGGIVNSKRGIYSAQGTAMAMQQMNNRNNLRGNDMRSAHVRMGRKILTQYATFGINPEYLRKYGDNTPTLKTALENYRNGKLGLLIKPATASNNKELEKQNDMLLLSTIERIQQGDQQLVASITTQQQMPGELKMYMMQCIVAKNALLRRILREFEHPDVERLAPLPEIIQKMLEEQQNGLDDRINSAGIRGDGNAGNSQPVAQTNGQVPQSGGSIPSSGVSANSGIPQLPAGGNDAGDTIQ
jgi:hypothetical protein